MLVLAIAMTVFAPVAVIAAGGHFNDDEDSIFEDHINWMADAEITLGCNPPTNDRYCPDDNVTRGEMAAFMRRLAQYLGAEDGTPAEADHAATADDADTLDGLDAGDLQPMWALVEGDDGSIIAQSGGIEVTRGFTGGHYIDFGTDVTGHAILATLQWGDAGMISAAICGGVTDETVFCVVGDDTPEWVFIETLDEAGDAADSDYYVTVLP